MVKSATYSAKAPLWGSKGIGISFRSGLPFASVHASVQGMVDLGTGSSACATLGKFRPRR